MKTHYYNAYHDGKGGFYIEQTAVNSRQEAVEEINDNGSKYTYAYTLEVSLEETKRIDLECEAVRQRHPDEYERLTGHEMGVCSGRV